MRLRLFLSKNMNIKEWFAQLNKKALGDVLRHKQRFVVMDTETYKEKFSFQLSGINLFVAIGLTLIVFVALTTVLIAFTPLREYIPGYTNTKMVEQTYRIAYVIDSLQNELDNQGWLIATIQSVLNDTPFEGDSLVADSTASLHAVAAAYRHSRADSLLRAEVDREDTTERYQVKAQSPAAQQPMSQQFASITAQLSQLFFAPVKGTVVAPFESAIRHYGVDVAAASGELVKSVGNGTVIFSNFTVENGHIIAIQHAGNVVSVYKHNSSLLKHEGDVVRTGEPIAFVGNSGTLSTGPHLHFELWVNGMPVDPQQYISF